MAGESQRLRAALADRYAIERELGAGGMATVYLAHDLKHDRNVALKVLRPELAAVLGAERFLAEIRITAKLDHPHILTLIDSGEAGGLLYYVLPYVHGESLRAKLERERQLGLDEALRITRQVAAALEHAHRQGVIHRDIKPENILLFEGEAMLADFGIALAVREAGGNRLTESGLSLGTPQYMSPEQATGDRTLDARSDVYSLGAVLYEMLAGVHALHQVGGHGPPVGDQHPRVRLPEHPLGGVAEREPVGAVAVQHHDVPEPGRREPLHHLVDVPLEGVGRNAEGPGVFADGDGDAVFHRGRHQRVHLRGDAHRQRLGHGVVGAVVDHAVRLERPHRQQHGRDPRRDQPADLHPVEVVQQAGAGLLTREGQRDGKQRGGKQVKSAERYRHGVLGTAPGGSCTVHRSPCTVHRATHHPPAAPVGVGERCTVHGSSQDCP
jgi:hypothetical protein